MPKAVYFGLVQRKEESFKDIIRPKSDKGEHFRFSKNRMDGSYSLFRTSENSTDLLYSINERSNWLEKKELVFSFRLPTRRRYCELFGRLLYLGDKLIERIDYLQSPWVRRGSMYGMCGSSSIVYGTKCCQVFISE